MSGDKKEKGPGRGSLAGAAEAALHQELDALRVRIETLDEELIRKVGERRDLVLSIGELKGRLGLPVMDPSREAAVVRRAAERARELNIDPELVRDVVWRIIAAAREAQRGEGSWGPSEPPPVEEGLRNLDSDG